MLEKIAIIILIFIHSSYGGSPAGGQASFSPSLKTSLINFLDSFVPEQDYLLVAKDYRNDNYFGNLNADLNFLPVRKFGGAEDLKLTAKYAIVIDVDTDKILYEKSPHAKTATASLSKVMTALTVLENISDLNEVVTISRKSATTGESTMFLEEGEQINIRDLLYGLIVDSANDAAVALAENVGESEEGFSDLMNKEAEKHNLRNSHFVVPHGLDAKGHFSSVFDLAQITDYALSYPFFRTIFGTESYEAHALNRDIAHEFDHPKRLLKESGLNIIGAKTGFTDEAGYCLITAARNSEGYEIVTVIINSEDQFSESEKLIKWVFENYEW